MAKRKSVEVVKGRRVIDPKTGRPMKAGEAHEVVMDQFWLRRMEDGDVIEASKSSAVKKAKEKK